MPDEKPGWTQDEIDQQVIVEDDEPDDATFYGEQCGRWRNGRLGPHCLLAGTEQCAFDCPYGWLELNEGRW